GALEVRQVLLGGGDRLRLVGHRNVHDAVDGLHGHGADLVGLVNAEAAALDHRRATHANVRVGGGDDDVAAAEDGGVAGEAVPGVHADERHEPAQATKEGERHAIETGHAGAVRVAGPPASAL